MVCIYKMLIHGNTKYIFWQAVDRYLEGHFTELRWHIAEYVFVIWQAQWIYTGVLLTTGRSLQIEIQILYRYKHTVHAQMIVWRKTR